MSSSQKQASYEKPGARMIKELQNITDAGKPSLGLFFTDALKGQYGVQDGEIQACRP
jgi:signal recognition particle GTPase